MQNNFYNRPWWNDHELWRGLWAPQMSKATVNRRQTRHVYCLVPCSLDKPSINETGRKSPQKTSITWHHHKIPKVGINPRTLQHCWRGGDSKWLSASSAVVKANVRPFCRGSKQGRIYKVLASLRKAGPLSIGWICEEDWNSEGSGGMKWPLTKRGSGAGVK